MGKRKLEGAEEGKIDNTTLADLFAAIERLEKIIISVEANLLNKIGEQKPVEVYKEDVGSSMANIGSIGSVSQANYVAPQWREYVNEKLGNDFGLDAEYSANGGFTVTITVPLEKSNAAKDYLDMHKVDRRTRAINPALGFEGVKQFVDLVAKNLNIKK